MEIMEINVKFTAIEWCTLKFTRWKNR